MMRKRITGSGTLAVLVVLSFLLPRQAAAQGLVGMPRDTLLAAAREIMAAARFCAFVTTGDDGRLQARTVDAFAPDDQWVVRIGTNRRTRKVGEIADRPDVTLYYFDRASLAYVTLQGRARVVMDTAETRRYWKPEWEAFYPDRAADYVLIAVIPVRLEVVSETRGIAGDVRTWRPPAVAFPEDR
jgi:general stress protein 26